jgi:hypothetical protein
VEELKAQAESLGIDVDGRWSEKRIQAEIDKALDAPAVVPDAAPVAAPVKPASVEVKPVTVTNLRDNPNKRLGLKGRGQIVLTAEQLADKQLMARIMHGVESGVLGLG